MRKVSGCTAEIVRRPKKPAPEGVMMAVDEGAEGKEGIPGDPKKFMAEKGSQDVLGREIWVAEITLSCSGHSRRMSP